MRLQPRPCEVCVRTSRSGFSVIEAVIAIAIAAIGLTAILTLQQQLEKSQIQANAALNRTNIRRAAIVLIKEINPIQKPTGQVQFAPGLRLIWASEVIEPPIQGAGFGGSPSMFKIGLYSVTVQIVDVNNRELDRFTVERLGWYRAVDASPY